MITPHEWREDQSAAMERTISELVEVGTRLVVPHGESLRLWREDRDAAILRARRAWTNDELSDRRVAQLVGCTPERVRQITDGVR